MPAAISGETAADPSSTEQFYTQLYLLSLSHMIRNVAVFCASANGNNSAYKAAAEELGRALASRSIGLIYGGAKVGLMQALAEAVLAANGRVIGVIPEVLVDLEVAHHGLTELHITDTMHTRKALMAEKADAFIALPGGFGTFEELFEVLAWHTLKIHAKPIVLLNTNGFYGPLIVFLDHCVGEGMLKQKNRDILRLANTVEEAMRLLQIAA
jgi:uncharacterized protein (TIGR00730 family)